MQLSGEIIEDMSIRFNNRQNERIDLPDGRVFWNSRSVAVVGSICVSTSPHDTYFLVVKRGSSVDNSGKLCLPCGYLDWDENGYQAFLREVYEETGLYVPHLKTPTSSFFDQPWMVNTSTKENRQNVVLHFGASYIMDQLPELDHQSLDSFSSNEIESALWLNYEDVLDDDFAFGHGSIIRKFYRELLISG
jgi:8-oxo-dGTP pyrophosphatase MutT (NUDIX family)